MCVCVCVRARACVFRVLYFSLHRYDEGDFFPGKDDANYDYIGSGNGTGYNVNVAWNWDSMGDTEYMMAFHHLLLPIATEVRVYHLPNYILAYNIVLFSIEI